MSAPTLTFPPLAETDPTIAAAIEREVDRQAFQLEFIATKNYLSRAVFEAHSSVAALISVEGYPGKRMHAGMANLDAIEELALARAREMFGCRYANVQPHSGTQANQAVFFALLDTDDVVLSLALNAGGHLSHGLRSNMSGRWFSAHEYGVLPDSGLIDYDDAAAKARELRPKLIITGGSAYPREIDYARLRAIADEVGAWFLVDAAHVAGQIVGGAHANPFPHAHVVTSVTNKNLRGCRGGLLLADDEELGRKLDSAVFPGIQGGPLPEYIAAKAVSFGETLTEEFRRYAATVRDNARELARTLGDRGYQIVTGGTDTPLVLVDLREQGVIGRDAQRSLERAGITCNRNLVPGDTRGPMTTSGLRFGTSAVTTRGVTPAEMTGIATTVADVLDGLVAAPDDTEAVERRAAERVRAVSSRFPFYVA